MNLLLDVVMCNVSTIFDPTCQWRSMGEAGNTPDLRKLSVYLRNSLQLCSFTAWENRYSDTYTRVESRSSNEGVLAPFGTGWIR